MSDGPAYGGLRAGVASITADEGLRSALTHVIGNTVQLLGVPASVSVTVVERDAAPTTLAGSDLHAFALDDAQYVDGDGPCLHAARTATLVRVDDLPRRSTWPRLQEASRRHRVRTSLSAPLTLSGHTVGSLNAYGRGAAGFTVADTDVLVTLAAQASVIAVNAQAYWAAFDGTRRLTIALQTRSEIDLARGMLMATHGISADDAFRFLTAAAQRLDRPVSEIARDILRREGVAGGDSDAGR